jgi:N-acetylglucosaminyl-diphospho-decaprenol L-rhamnosyltransferase
VSEPEVTIVVIAHSVRDELVRCFASIRDHAGIPVRTILVDNASTDDTLDWVERTHPEVEVIALSENLVDAARDRAMGSIDSPYTMFLDSDAMLTPGALPAMVDAMNANPTWGLLGPRLVRDDGSVQESCRRFPPLLLPFLRRPPLGRFFEHGPTVQRHLMADFDYDRTRPVLYVIGACQLFRTSLGRAAGPFDRRAFRGIGWHDADWCLRIRDAGGEIVFFAEATVVHSYRRATAKRPMSLAAVGQLQAFVHFQRTYRRRRRALIRLADDLDRAADAGSVAADVEHVDGR